MSKKVLIVEDEAPLANALELKLNNAGIETKIAQNGEEALKILEKEKFDLILLDLILPIFDGFSVLEKLKKRKDKTKVIVASNLSQDTDIKKAKQLGAVDFYIKSNTSIKDIIKHVEENLKK